MEVSIIIVNYNTIDLVIDCIESIYEKTKNISFEIIVVDNASIDNSVNLLTEKFPKVKLLALEQNIGFGKANNEGVKLAEGDTIFFLNSDTLLINDAISILCEYLKKHPQVGLCGGNLYTKNLKPNVSYSPFPSIFCEMKNVLGINKSQLKKTEFYNETESKKINGYISGADILVRKELIEKYAFDPDFFMYYEDVELSYRISQLGYEIHSVSDAKIIHLQGMSAESKNKELKLLVSSYLIESKLIYFRKISCYSFLLDILYTFKAVVAFGIYNLFRDNEKLLYWKYILFFLLGKKTV